MMPRHLLVTCALLAAACGSRSGSFTITWDGTIDGTAAQGTKTYTLAEGDQWLVEALKDQTRSAPCEDALPCFSTHALVLPARGSTEAAPPVLLTAYRLYTVPLVGKGMTRAFFSAGGSEVEGVVDITRVKLTGDANDPLEVHGTFDQQVRDVGARDGKRRDLKVSGEFTVLSSCADGASTHVQFICPMNNPQYTPEVEEAQYYGRSNVTVPWYQPGLGIEPAACPEGIFSKFVDGSTATFERGSLKIGAATPLSCNGHFCSAQATVQAGGCTWDVTAIAQPGAALQSNANSTGYPKATQVFVSATAQSGCSSEVTYCQAR